MFQPKISQPRLISIDEEETWSMNGLAAVRTDELIDIQSTSTTLSTPTPQYKAI